MESAELFIDVTVKGSEHHLTIKHDDDLNATEISVDNELVNTRIRLSKNIGAAYTFEIDSTPAVVTIIKKPDDADYSYDCFIDEKSVQNDMPWSFGKLDYFAALKWEHVRKKGFPSYLITQIMTGGLIGAVLFFIIILVKVTKIIDQFNINNWVLLAISILPFLVLYGAFAFIEWKDYERAFASYQDFLKNGLPSDNKSESEETPNYSAESDEKDE